MALNFSENLFGKSIFKSSPDDRMYLAFEGNRQIPTYPNDSIIEEYIQNDTGYQGMVSADDRLFMSFTLGTKGRSKNYFISYVIIKAYRVLSPGTVNVSIRLTDGSGYPTGSDLSTGSFNGNDLTTAVGGQFLEVSMTSYELQKDTQYAIILSAPGADANNKLRWRRDDILEAYTGGRAGYSSDAEASWVFDGTSEYMFEVWGY